MGRRVERLEEERESMGIGFDRVTAHTKKERDCGKWRRRQLGLGSNKGVPGE